MIGTQIRTRFALDELTEVLIDVAVTSVLLSENVPNLDEVSPKIKDNLKRGMRVGRSFNRVVSVPDTAGEYFSRMALQNGIVKFYDITDTFDWYGGKFGDYGACFMGGEMDYAREALENEGGFAIRTYDEDGKGNGRAWLVEHYTDVDLVFNGYMGGQSSNHTARIAALWAAHKTRATGELHAVKYIDLWWDSGYVNSGSGYVIAPATEWDTLNDSYEVPIDADQYQQGCEYCGQPLDDWGRNYIEGHGDFCDDCLSEHFSYCDSCYEYYPNDEVQYSEYYNAHYCEAHYDDLHSTCELCANSEAHDNGVTVESEGVDIFLCHECHEYDANSCDECCDTFLSKDMSEDDGFVYCDDCYNDYVLPRIKEQESNDRYHAVLVSNGRDLLTMTNRVV